MDTLPAAPRSNTAILSLLSVLFILKLGLLLSLKPIVYGDSLQYIDFADRILGNKEWLYHLDLSSQVIEFTAFRMIGYPLIIAIFKFLSPNLWPYFVCFLQLCLSFYCGYVLYRFGLQNGLPHKYSILATTAYAAAYPVYIDQYVMSDSIFASLCVIFFCKADRLMFGDVLAPKLKYFKIGLLAGAFFLIRPTAPVVLLAAVPLAFIAVMKRPVIPRLTRMISLLLPFLSVSILYGAWNYARSGIFFLTTGSQTALMVTVMRIASKHPDVLKGDDLLSQTARKTFKEYNWGEMIIVNEKLFQTYGLTGPEIAALAQKKYLEVALHYPKFVIQYAYKWTPWAVLVAPFRILESLKDLIEETKRGSYWPSTRRLLEREVSTWKSYEILFVALVNISRAAGLTVTLFFLIGVPARSVKELLRSRTVLFETRRRLAYCVLFVLYIAGHALIHIEDRYLAPAYAISSSFGMLMLYEYIQHRTVRSQPVPIKLV